MKSEKWKGRVQTRPFLFSDEKGTKMILVAQVMDKKTREVFRMREFDTKMELLDWLSQEYVPFSRVIEISSKA
jgi:hypothetical protein